MIRRRRSPAPARGKPRPARIAGRPGQRAVAPSARRGPRLAWWLISAPGAALVRWRSLLGREDAPITGKRVGWATLTVLYTLAIYGALVLLVVYWSTPNSERTGASAASSVRLPLQPCSPTGSGTEHADAAPEEPRHAPEHESAPPTSPTRHPAPRLKRPAAYRHAGDWHPSTATPPPARCPRPSPRPDHRNPRRTARQLAGCIEGRATTLRGIEFLRPAGLRLGRAHAILRTQPGWGTVKECPARP